MDLDRVEQLLNVAAASRDYPKLKPIHDWCIAELEKIAAEPIEEEKDDK